MAINDLLGSLKRGVVRAGLGLALVTGAGACGDTNNYYGENGNDGNNTCETACDNIEYCCSSGQGDSNCEDFSFSECLQKCQGNYVSGVESYDAWSNHIIECFSTTCDLKYCDDQ